jgi:hypothetical protein
VSRPNFRHLIREPREIRTTPITTFLADRLIGRSRFDLRIFFGSRASRQYTENAARLRPATRRETTAIKRPNKKSRVRMTSGSNCLHLNRPETDDARSIGPAYQTTPVKLQHCQKILHPENQCRETGSCEQIAELFSNCYAATSQLWSLPRRNVLLSEQTT